MAPTTQVVPVPPSAQPPTNSAIPQNDLVGKSSNTDLVIDLGTSGLGPRFHSASAAELALAEREVTQRLADIGTRIAGGELSAVSIGGGRFELVSPAEASSLGAERSTPNLNLVNGGKIRNGDAKQMMKRLEKSVVIGVPSSSRVLESACACLGVQAGQLEIQQFKDGEQTARVLTNVRERDVFLIGGTHPPADKNLVELCLAIQALKLASASSVTVVMPYFGYARQDRRTEGRTGISAKLAANFIEAAGANKLVTIDLHSRQIEGFFGIPVDNLPSSALFVPFIRKHFPLENVAIVAADAGSAKRARDYSSLLDDAPVIQLDKRRLRANEVEEIHVLGDPKGRVCIIVDDLIDTGNTLALGAKRLVENGAASVVACCTHPVLSGRAVETLNKSALSKVITLDTIPARRPSGEKFVRLPSATLLAEAIARILGRDSVGEIGRIDLLTPHTSENGGTLHQGNG